MTNGLLLFHLDEAVFNVSPTHADHVRAALARIERQQHHKARHAARWVLCFKSGDLCVSPCVVSVACDLERLDAEARIVFEQFILDSKRHETANVFEELVRLSWCRTARVEHRLHVFALKAVSGLLAMLFAKPLEDASIGALRIWCESAELR